MKDFNCSSDIGSVLVGNEIVRFALPNQGGDGTTRLCIFESQEEFDNSNFKNTRFFTCIEGQFHIYVDDCCHGDPDDIIYTVPNGRYGVYNTYMTVILVKWN